MTDREMLELAVKAVELEWWGNGIEGESEVDYPTNWNPLTDDGDALRLAVKLGLEIYFGDDEDGTSVHVGYAFDPDSDSMIRYCIEPCRADPYAATRRAITRAAAEIGRAKK